MKEYVSPIDKSLLIENDNILSTTSGGSFPIIKAGDYLIPNFVNQDNEVNLNMNTAVYDHEHSVEVYNNFKEWLFSTFGEKEHDFRLNIMKKVINGSEKKILITGCGLGDDIMAALELSNFKAQIYVSDLSKTMVLHAAKSFDKYKNLLSFSICDGCKLPFSDNYFDAAFHFGGINLFDDIELAISEMTRVVRPSGAVGFGDESVAPWLRDTDYGKMIITNSKFWSALTPIEMLPFEATDVKLEWVLGNSFYFISFLKKQDGPYMNIDIPHKGTRGGSMRTRYYGTLEAVSSSLKERVIAEAKHRDMSVHAFMERALSDFIEK
jgi:ubiquinone/menaquinone biosynthesis C-methylase UbiE